jgi:MFS family permease
MGAFCLNGAMTSALAADIISQRSLDGKLSWINTSISAGAIVSFLSTGYLLEMVSPRNLFFLATILPVLAAGIIQVVTTRIASSKPYSALQESDCYKVT